MKKIHTKEKHGDSNEFCWFFFVSLSLLTKNKSSKVGCENFGSLIFVY